MNVRLYDMTIMERSTDSMVNRMQEQYCDNDYLIKKAKSKQKIYWDVDDVVIDTTSAAVNYINKHYNIPLGKREKDRRECKDWKLKSIYKDFSCTQLMEMFESDEFWQEVKVHPEFFAFVKSGKFKDYQNIFLTKGSQINLEKKREYLEKALGKDFLEFDFIGLSNNDRKIKIDMYGAIQIDDNIENLDGSNAKLKILYKDHKETTYNNSFMLDRTVDNLYMVEEWSDIQTVLEFNSDFRL